MGEISRDLAAVRRDSDVAKINSMKAKIRQEFEEMEFENADKRKKFEEVVEGMEDYCDSMVKNLNNIWFE